MKTRDILFAASIGVGGMLGAGCSSETKTAPTAAPAHDLGSIACKADSPEKWERTPANFKSISIALVLGVTQEQITEGRFGAATCEESIKLQDIQKVTNHTPTLSVEGQGDKCIAIGTQVDPSTVTETNQLLVICAADEATA